VRRGDGIWPAAIEHGAQVGDLRVNVLPLTLEAGDGGDDDLGT
jgi:hypothetical protein